MKPKAYGYIGEPIPSLNGPEHAEFLALLEKSVLYSLEKRNLISRSERDRSLTEIDRLLTKDSGKHQA